MAKDLTSCFGIQTPDIDMNLWENFYVPGKTYEKLITEGILPERGSFEKREYEKTV